MNQDNYKQLLSTKFKNQSTIEEYIDYIQNHKLSNDTLKSATMYEVHHILPESIFDEYKHEPSNLVKLTLYDHLVAHYILAKTQNSKMLFAFNMMSRIRHSGILTEEQLDEAAKMYSELRKDISSNVSKMRKSKPIVFSDAGILTLSKASIGKVYVIENGSGKTIKITTDEYRANPDLYTHTSAGKIHSEETKKKISDNGIKGKTAFTHKETGTLLYEDESFSNPNYTKGNPISSKTAIEKFKDASHWTNTITGECVRSKKCPGDDWVKKRSNFENPFKGNAILIDIKTGEKGLYPQDNISPQHCTYNKIVLVSSTHIYSTKEEICEIINVEKSAKNVINVVDYIRGKKVTAKFKSEANLTELSKFKAIRVADLRYDGQIII